MIRLDLPELLAITADAGAGKDTTQEILNKWAIKASKRVLSFGSGDLLRIYAERDTPLGIMVKTLLNQGERIPLPLVSQIVEDYLLENLGKYDHFLVNGSPRFVQHCDVLYGYLTKGYFQSFKILEVIAPHELCRNRLIERTKKDKRLDLSVDGHPGVPDETKIDRKMRWWSNEQESIRTRAKELGVYLEVRNDGTLVQLQNQLAELFTQTTLP